ncbi:MAG: IS110 family transposase [Xanthomonadales bacterium]|nr:IS110 family transposase [Xanthomonadales bacterium]
MFSTGIDVSAKTLDVVVRINGKRRHRRFNNDGPGIGKLIEWLKPFGPVRVSMEATGVYYLDLAFALVGADIPLMVVNPRQARRFVEALGRNQQTDASDAADLAEFGERMDFVAWKAPSKQAFTVHKLGRSINLLTRQHTAYLNRLHAAEAAELTPPEVVALMRNSLRFIEREQAKLVRKVAQLIAADAAMARRLALLKSATGIAEASAPAILAELIVLPEGLSAKAWVKLAGLDPTTKQSGTSVSTKPRISKRGNARLRAALYMPAMCARSHDAHLRAFADRLSARGKTGNQVILAVARKLLHGIHAMFHSDQPWDSQRLVSTEKHSEAA